MIDVIRLLEFLDGAEPSDFFSRLDQDEIDYLAELVRKDIAEVD